MRKIDANGMKLPVLGQGGWTLGDDPARKREEIYALRYGIELGMNLIDTAEMYGDGASEMLIGEAVREVDRDHVILVTKVFPYNAGKDRIFTSCENSLRRLGTEYIDLYLLHWRGDIPLGETVECMEELVRQGKIRRWGVSNFDEPDMTELWETPGGSRCAADQVMYSIGSRGIEFDLLPWAQAHGLGVMAYEPLLQAGKLRRMHPDIMNDSVLLGIAEEHGVTVPQLMLAFVLRNGGTLAIPKSVTPAHIRENAEAAEIELSAEDMRRIDGVFWPPTSKMHLDID